MSPSQTFSDVHDIHEASTPTVTTSSDSSLSVSTGSPTLLNPESLDVRSHLGSFHGTPTVKFAPLPETDPNRKRSLAPLGVSGRSRRRRVIQHEDGWCPDADVPEENMEDPLVAFAKFVKKATKTLWRRVRRGSKAVQVVQENMTCSAEVLDIRPTVHSDESEDGDGEDVQRRRASWSPSNKRRTLSLGQVKRRSTSDLVRLRVIV